jgi:hypothetical protein
MGKAMQEGLEEVGDAVSEQAEDSASDEGSE